MTLIGPANGLPKNRLCDVLHLVCRQCIWSAGTSEANFAIASAYLITAEGSTIPGEIGGLICAVAIDDRGSCVEDAPQTPLSCGSPLRDTCVACTDGLSSSSWVPVSIDGF